MPMSWSEDHGPLECISVLWKQLQTRKYVLFWGAKSEYFFQVTRPLVLQTLLLAYSIDPFRLYILLSHYKSCDNNQEDWFFVLLTQKNACKHEYCIYSNKRRSPVALTADIFVFVIMKLSGFFNRVNFSRNSRFTISLVSVNRKINR